MLALRGRIMLKTSLLPVIAASLLLGGCATLFPERPQEAVTRTYPYSRDAVWRRILATSARNSLFIRQADPVSGVITVDREIASPNVDMFTDSIFDWAACPQAGPIERTLSQHIEINYLVRQERDGTTTVTVNDRFGEQRRNIPMQREKWVNCTSTGLLERNLLDSLYYDHVG
jgi:hypothetical protein